MSFQLSWIDDELNKRARIGLGRRRLSVTSLPDGWCKVDGQKLRNFASNDYLNLAHDTRVIAAAAKALREAGAGAGASPLVSGRSPFHERLEMRLAEFERAGAAILFPTGFAANLGTITALVGQGDGVFCDRLNHASLVDGCRLSAARLRVYRHDDLTELDDALVKDGAARRRLIVSDSVFSMEGDHAPLVELCQIAERRGAMLMVDEAHATGVYGEHGSGLVEHLGLSDRVAVRVGTLSKAIGSLGGFAVGSAPLIDWLWNVARTQMYSTALPPSACAAAETALGIIETEPDRRRKLWELGARFRQRLAENSINTPSAATGPIVPILLESPDRAVHVASRLQTRGFLVGAIRPPTVPSGTSRLRITMSAAHCELDVDALSTALTETLAEASDRIAIGEGVSE